MYYLASISNILFSQRGSVAPLMNKNVLKQIVEFFYTNVICKVCFKQLVICHQQSNTRTQGQLKNIVQTMHSADHDAHNTSIYNLYMHFYSILDSLKLVATDRRTDRPTDRRTDIARYRAAIAAKNHCTLKWSFSPNIVVWG